MKKLGDNNIIGNTALCNRLYSDIKAGTLSHAYIIEGRSGSGKHTLAKNIIAALACLEDKEFLPCGQCKNCRDIFQDNCPDVFTIGRDGKSSLGIDAVRTLKNTISIVPNNLDFKAYILEDADTMTPQAQNAFLLTLEQPPARAYFFILCESARSLLETIRSRAPVVRMEPLSNEQIFEYISSDKVKKSVSDAAKSIKNDSPEEYETILIESGGSIGRAIELLSPKTRKPLVEVRTLALNFIDSFRIGREFYHPLLFFSKFSSKREELIYQLEYIKLCLRDLILLKKSDNVDLCFFADREKALELSSSLAEKKLLSIFEAISNSQALLSNNANVSLTLTDLLASF